MPSAILSTESASNDPEEDLGEFILIDDLFKARAKDKVQRPLVAFPKSERGVSDFEYFTGRDLDRFVEHTAKHYLEVGLKIGEYARVALLGPTNLEWFATLFGLLRAGLAVVTLSARISAQAIVNLMSEAQCDTIIHADTSHLLRVVDQVKDQGSFETVPILPRIGFDRPLTSDPPIIRDIDKAKEAERLIIIMHSSGSTGLPKPIYTNHNRYVQSINPVNPGTRDFMTLPITIYFLNANLPLTRDNVNEAMTAARPDAVYAVPYILKLLAENPESIEVLRSCHEVMTLGSRCPDELGDSLVNQGVNLCNFLGS
ncbi:MAG: hypothetical protein Q9166_001703 [cf. Caloplaca sp. 2 TL-2023]